MHFISISISNDFIQQATTIYEMMKKKERKKEFNK